MENRPMHILLIEDNPGDAFLIKFYLEESIFKDARLIHAEFLNTALDLLSKNEFDVVLLDLNLPDSKGIETLKQVLDACKHSVVIVLTGLADEELGIETVQLGAQDFLVKGQFDGKVFTSSVRYAFERYRLLRQVEQVHDSLDEYQQQFQYAQDLAGFGYWELDLKDNSMFWSDKLYQLLGAEKSEETLELSTFVSAFNKHAEQLENAFKQAIDGKSDIDLTIEQNGQKLVLRSQSVNDEKGHVERLAGVLLKL